MSIEALMAVAELDNLGFITLKEGQCLADVARIIDSKFDTWGEGV
jgi:hypothetical protein